MDSLDALPSADYASLLTISPPHDKTGAGKGEIKENVDSIQEHIYDQVTPNGLPQTNEVSSQGITIKQEQRKFDKRSKKSSINHTYVLRNPTVSLNHANSVPDVRKPSTELPSLFPKKYGSINTAKADKKVLKFESETEAESSVFSISGRRVIVSSGYKGNKNSNSAKDGRNEQASYQSNDMSLGIIMAPVSLLTFVLKEEESDLIIPSLWSRSPSAQSQTDNKRRRLQGCTDCLSLCLFVPGTLLCILSPWLLVPIYIIPNFSGSHFQTLVWVICVGSAMLVFMGCMVGNMVWYRKGKDWKFLLHCGKGPRDHYWGDSLSSRTLHIV